MHGPSASEPWQDPPRAAPAEVVGRAIQDSAAPRLGRAFVPTALLFLAGFGSLAFGGASGHGWLLLVGAPLTAVAMLANVQRMVQRAFGRPWRPWMALARAGAALPPVYGVYVFGWHGLRSLAVRETVPALLGGVVLALLGAWLLRAWMNLVEVQRLAAVMSDSSELEGGWPG